jgi:hypothetical protein
MKHDNAKRFDPAKSPFHLLFLMDSKFMVKEFSSMEELARFVKSLGLSWNDYGIIHGEMVKELPTKDEEVDDDDIDDAPESMITTLDPDEARKLAEQDQQ